MSTSLQAADLSIVLIRKKQFQLDHRTRDDSVSLINMIIKKKIFDSKAWPECKPWSDQTAFCAFILKLSNVQAPPEL